MVHPPVFDSASLERLCVDGEPPERVLDQFELHNTAAPPHWYAFQIPVSFVGPLYIS